MTTSTLDTSLRSRLNQCTANELADMLRSMRLGDVVRALPVQIGNVGGAVRPLVASGYNLATLQVVQGTNPNALGLADDAKAATILRAYARATSNAGTLGELAIQTFGTTPADGQIAVTPNGDIAVLASSAYTLIDLLYVPQKQQIVELTLPVATNAAAIPAAYTAMGVVSLLEAEALAGTVTGKKIVLVPSASTAGSTAQARLDLAKANVKFNSGDAVTSCRVKIGVNHMTDVDALLEAASIFI